MIRARHPHACSPQEASSDKENLYPHAAELLVGALAFAIMFFFMWKWVLPRVNTLLEERRAEDPGRARAGRGNARARPISMLADYREQLAGAREEANRIIEEARKTADQLRSDMQAKAEEESQAIVARAQDEIRAERDRVFQELRSQVGEIAVELAGRIVAVARQDGARALIDEYIDQVAAGRAGRLSVLTIGPARAARSPATPRRSFAVAEAEGALGAVEDELFAFAQGRSSSNPTCARR